MNTETYHRCPVLQPHQGHVEGQPVPDAGRHAVCLPRRGAAVGLTGSPGARLSNQRSCRQTVTQCQGGREGEREDHLCCVCTRRSVGRCCSAAGACSTTARRGQEQLLFTPMPGSARATLQPPDALAAREHRCTLPRAHRLIRPLAREGRVASPWNGGWRARRGGEEDVAASARYRRC